MKKLHLTVALIASTTMILMTGCANKTQSGAAIDGLAGGAIGHNEQKKDEARRGY